jgi:hypothetical protein
VNASRPGAAGAHALSHEAGHLFLKGWVDARTGRADSAVIDSAAAGHYGSALMPDWFDEAVATLCEFPALQANRRARLLDSLDQRIPLAELFTMAHPVAASEREMIERAMKQMGGGAKPGMLVLRGEGALLSNRARMFYAESLTLAQFMIAREGPRFIRTIAEGLALQASMADILRDAEHLPHDPAALEAEWVAWLRK